MVVVKKVFCLLSLFIFLNSCNIKSVSLESVVENRYNECKDKENCIIDFSQAMNFNWDNLYCFEEGISNNGVSKAIGFDYSGNKDLSRLILFIKDKKIIYEQNQTVDYDNPYKISFYSQKYKYTRSEAKFLIEKDKERDVYLLTPVNLKY